MKDLFSFQTHSPESVIPDGNWVCATIIARGKLCRRRVRQDKGGCLFQSNRHQILVNMEGVTTRRLPGKDALSDLEE